MSSKPLTLDEVVDRIMRTLKTTGSVYATYTLTYPENVGIIVIEGIEYITESIGFTPLARAVRRAIEREYGELYLVRSIGFRGEVYENKRIYLRIEAGWGTLTIDARLK